MNRLLILILVVLANGIVSIAQADVEAGDSQPEPAAELKIDEMVLLEAIVGGSTVKASNSSGQTWQAKVGDTLLTGETIETDAEITADLRLSDGSLIRVAPVSTFSVDDVVLTKENFWQWSFRLLRGGIISIIRKGNVSAVKLKVTTPTGTVGVRGTEFSLDYEPLSTETTLYTKSGEVLFSGVRGGHVDFEKAERVGAGQVSLVLKNQARPDRAAALTDALKTRNARFRTRIARLRELRRSRKTAVIQKWFNRPDAARKNLRNQMKKN